MKRNVVIGIVAGALVVVLLWYFAFYNPKSNDVSSTNAKKTEAQRQTQTLRATLARLRSLDKERPQQQATLDQLNAAIPDTPDLANFIFQANEIAAQSGVDWLSVAPTPPAPSAAGGPSVIALNIQVQGGFFQVLDYLNRLEKLTRLVVTDTVSISSSASTSSGSGGSTTGTTLPTSTSSSGAPTLNVTLGARMFTRATVVPGAAGTPGSTGTAPGGTTSTTPTTTPASSTPTGRAGNS